MGSGLPKDCEPMGLEMAGGCEPIGLEKEKGCRCPVARIAG